MSKTLGIHTICGDVSNAIFEARALKLKDKCKEITNGDKKDKSVNKEETKDEDKYIEVPNNSGSFDSVSDDVKKLLDKEEKSNLAIDEEIEDSRQGYHGDCWLISSINALSYDEKGREIISNAITKKEGGYEVYFAGDNKTIYVSDEEILAAKAEGTYSKGDDDVLLMELAFEKLYDSYPLQISNPVDNGGFESYAIYHLTGDSNQTCINYNHGIHKYNPFTTVASDMFGLTNPIDDAYDKIEQDPERYATTINFVDPSGEHYPTVKDIDGNEVVLGSPHAWALKEVHGDYVYMVNPWDASNVVVVSKDEISPYVSCIECYDYEQNNV